MLKCTLSREAVNYCNSIRGKNYEGCGSDAEFCSLCKSVKVNVDSFNKSTRKLNELAKDK